MWAPQGPRTERLDCMDHAVMHQVHAAAQRAGGPECGWTDHQPHASWWGVCTAHHVQQDLRGHHAKKAPHAWRAVECMGKAMPGFVRWVGAFASAPDVAGGCLCVCACIVPTGPGIPRCSGERRRGALSVMVLCLSSFRCRDGFVVVAEGIVVCRQVTWLGWRYHTRIYV